MAPGTATTVSGITYSYGRVYVVSTDTGTGWIDSGVITATAPSWTANIPADPQPSKDQLRRIQHREWSWAAIARRERELLCERRPAPTMPPRPRPGRRRVTSPAERLEMVELLTVYSALAAADKRRVLELAARLGE